MRKLKPKLQNLKKEVFFATHCTMHGIQSILYNAVNIVHGIQCMGNNAWNTLHGIQCM
jgi:hypothetical protein